MGIMDKGSIVRTLVLLVALVNQTLVMFGKSPLPFDGEFLEQFISTAFTIISASAAWFKNNYVTKTGIQQKHVLLEKGLTKGGRKK
ncbi:phage holin [Virgibacillus byunsanensis]|uniref:Phage holin n=1 Tax=Virgibacillus byunsanensis TaxID=570945 RepID=A0ABW3LP08_9BACI